MTDTAAKPSGVTGSLPAHPLTPASGQEFLAGRAILAGAGRYSSATIEPTRSPSCGSRRFLAKA